MTNKLISKLLLLEPDYESNPVFLDLKEKYKIVLNERLEWYEKLVENGSITEGVYLRWCESMKICFEEMITPIGDMILRNQFPNLF